MTIIDEKEVKALEEVLSDDFCKLFDDGQGQDCDLDCDNCRARRVIEAGYHKSQDNQTELASAGEPEEPVKDSVAQVCDICFNAPHGMPCPDGGCRNCTFAVCFAEDIERLVEKHVSAARDETLLDVRLFLVKHINGFIENAKQSTDKEDYYKGVIDALQLAIFHMDELRKKVEGQKG